jgi:hypothetical protein
MNRIAEAIATQEQNITDRLADGRTTQDKLDKLHTTLDMELFEYVRFQELKSVAVSAQTITLEEGQTVYAYLGESPETFNKQSLAVKVTLTELFRGLMQMQVA